MCGVRARKRDRHHPTQEELQNETVRKIKDLYKYDCLRANKSTMAWGVEARVPFLDKVGRVWGFGRAGGGGGSVSSGWGLG